VALLSSVSDPKVRLGIGQWTNRHDGSSSGSELRGRGGLLNLSEHSAGLPTSQSPGLSSRPRFREEPWVWRQLGRARFECVTSWDRHSQRATMSSTLRSDHHTPEGPRQPNRVREPGPRAKSYRSTAVRDSRWLTPVDWPSLRWRSRLPPTGRHDPGPIGFFGTVHETCCRWKPTAPFARLGNFCGRIRRRTSTGCHLRASAARHGSRAHPRANQSSTHMAGDPGRSEPSGV